jgi:hypothetical protein
MWGSEDPFVVTCFSLLWNLMLTTGLGITGPAWACEFVSPPIQIDQSMISSHLTDAIPTLVVKSIAMAVFMWVTHADTFACVDPTGFTPPPANLHCPHLFTRLVTLLVLLGLVDRCWRLLSRDDTDDPSRKHLRRGRLVDLPIQYMRDWTAAFMRTFFQYALFFVAQAVVRLNVWDALAFSIAVEALHAWSNFATTHEHAGLIDWAKVSALGLHQLPGRMTHAVLDRVWSAVPHKKDNPFAVHAAARRVRWEPTNESESI